MYQFSHFLKSQKINTLTPNPKKYPIQSTTIPYSSASFNWLLCYFCFANTGTAQQLYHITIVEFPPRVSPQIRFDWLRWSPTTTESALVLKVMWDFKICSHAWAYLLRFWACFLKCWTRCDEKIKTISFFRQIKQFHFPLMFLACDP